MWNLAENVLIADDVYADLYGFDAGEVAEGVSIEEVIHRILDEDRAEAARATYQAILSGKFTTVQFRVSQNGTTRRVVSFGRCLRDAAGAPSVFTGGVFEFGTEFVRAVMARQLCH